MPGGGSCYEVFTQMVTNFACNAGDLGSIPGLGRSRGEGNSYPLQYSCLKNPMDRRVWWAAVQRVSEESDTIEQLSIHTHTHTHTHTHS